MSLTDVAGAGSSGHLFIACLRNQGRVHDGVIATLYTLWLRRLNLFVNKALGGNPRPQKNYTKYIGFF